MEAAQAAAMAHAGLEHGVGLDAQQQYEDPHGDHIHHHHHLDHHHQLLDPHGGAPPPSSSH